MKSTADEDLAILYLCRIDLSAGNVKDVAEQIGSFTWHGIPGDAALLLAADIYLRLDWFTQAHQCLEDYLKSFPEDLDAKRKFGLVKLMLDENRSAERILQAVARRERYKVPETLSYIAMLEAKAGRLEESCHLLLQARELAPSDKRIEHSLLRIEAMRVRLKRHAMNPGELPFQAMVEAMLTGMLSLHGYNEETSRLGRKLWEDFCGKGERPHGRKPAIWAAAVEYAVTRNGLHYSQDQLAVEYGVSSSQLREHYLEICKKVKISEYQIRDLLTQTSEEGNSLYSLVRGEELAGLLSELGNKFSDFDGPGKAVDWILERMNKVTESERREIEDFVRYLWEKHH